MQNVPGGSSNALSERNDLAKAELYRVQNLLSARLKCECGLVMDLQNLREHLEESQHLEAA